MGAAGMRVAVMAGIPVIPDMARFPEKAAAPAITVEESEAQATSIAASNPLISPDMQRAGQCVPWLPVNIW
ncbi:hypothetical protein GCM10027277_51900 [Pseudoduganella ginsengisoli]